MPASITDILFTGDYQMTAKGDLQTISDIENLRQAIYLRLITSPGEIIHRPLFGVGIKSFMNRPCNDNNKQRLVNRVRLNILRERRISKIHSITVEWSDSMALINLKIEAFGTELNLRFEVVK